MVCLEVFLEGGHFLVLVGYLQQDLKDFSNHLGVPLSDPLNQGLHEQDFLCVQYYFSNYVQDLGGLYHLISPVSVPLSQGLPRLQNLSALNYVPF